MRGGVTASMAIAAKRKREKNKASKYQSIPLFLLKNTNFIFFYIFKLKMMSLKQWEFKLNQHQFIKRESL